VRCVPKGQGDVYQASPAAKYRVGPVPLITITRVVGMLFQIVLMYYWFTVNALGLTNYDVPIFILAPYIVEIVWYFAFKAIPPE
jgi:hypothetical protein